MSLSQSNGIEVIRVIKMLQMSLRGGMGFLFFARNEAKNLK